jgi:hypothetical protein
MLSPEQFAEIIAVIQTTQDDGIKSEVRRAPRIPHPCHQTIVLGNPQTPGPTFVVNMIDISHHGMCFIHDGEFDVGMEFVVRLQANNGEAVSLLAKIVHWKPAPGRGNQFGAQFTAVIDRKEMQLAEPTAEDLMYTRNHLLD